MDCEIASQLRLLRFRQAAEAIETGAYRSASSPCISVRCNSQSSGGVHFVFTAQWVIIPPCSGRFAECRRFCSDGVATDGTKEG